LTQLGFVMFPEKTLPLTQHTEKTMQKFSTRTLLLINLGVMAIIGTFALLAFNGKEKLTAGGTISPEQAVRSVNLDKQFTFCGEALPMENFDVKQRLDAELLRNIYFHSSTILAIKRANSLFPTIEPILQKEGVPDDLKYLAVAESGLTNAVSPAGAKGVWQFMKSAADQYGMEVTTEVDERYDVEKATRAACKYLRHQRERLGSWALAAAAYNGGPERIATEKANQRANSFYEMNLAAEETMRYPFRIVAIKEVMENKELYEYFVAKEHLYEPLNQYKEVVVTETINNLADFAIQNGTTYRMLKIYNPWLLTSKLTARPGKSYTLRVPN
jgi:membrane-bound lytic murein transglycosylase D